MAEKKEEEKPVQKKDGKKKSKYDLTIKTALSPDELFKLAANTSIKKKGKKK
jgi:hypothetical protein